MCQTSRTQTSYLTSYENPWQKDDGASLFVKLGLIALSLPATLFSGVTLA